jgi:hypothetical protein
MELLEVIAETADLEAVAWHAIYVNDLACLCLLTNLGANLTTRNENSLSTLDYAVQENKQGIFFFLLNVSRQRQEIPCSDHFLELASGKWSTDQMYGERIRAYGIRRAALREES